MNDLIPLKEIRRLALSGGSILFFGEAMSRLSAYLMGLLSARGLPLTLVDAAQAFDPYLVARIGRFKGIPPRLLLERIRLSRAFTCHQLVTLLCETLPRDGRKEPLFILGPCGLFYDDQVALKERQALFKQVLRSLKGLKERGQRIFLFQPPLARQIKKYYFGRDLARSVHWVIRVHWAEERLEGRLYPSFALPARKD